MFRKIGNSWSQIGSNIDGEAAGDQSGWSVSLSRDGDKLTVAIGAVKNDAGINNPDADIGHVRGYELV